MENRKLFARFDELKSSFFLITLNSSSVTQSSNSSGTSCGAPPVSVLSPRLKMPSAFPSGNCTQLPSLGVGILDAPFEAAVWIGCGSACWVLRRGNARSASSTPCRMPARILFCCVVRFYLLETICGCVLVLEREKSLLPGRCYWLLDWGSRSSSLVKRKTRDSFDEEIGSTKYSRASGWVCEVPFILNSL